MIADLKPDESVAIQQNSDDVNLRISYDINPARNTLGRVHQCHFGKNHPNSATCWWEFTTSPNSMGVCNYTS
jgi:hypothetical protein